MDLTKLAWFFKSDVDACLADFLARVPRSDARSWLVASRNNLLDDLLAVTHRALVAQYKVVETEVGFDEFCESLQDDEVREYLHARYPLLGTSIANVCRAWLDQASAIAQRFERDLELLSTTLLPGDAPPEIDRVEFGLGDGHRGGRSVALLTFRDGRRLVYKPRNLAIDTHFAQLLVWVNERCGTDLWVPAHLDRGEYGWVQFVLHEPCKNLEEVERFYRRMGSLLALLYVVEGNDFHHENIIAVGEHPVAIDLESMFQPQLPGVDEVMVRSVLKVGLLPHRLGAPVNMPEMSGLSDAEGELGRESLAVIQGEDGTLSLVRRRAVLQGANNVPVLDGAKVELGSQHAAQLKLGFERVYRAIMDDVAGFVPLVEACANDPVRVLFRHTGTYVQLLEEARHPLLMASPSATAEHYALLRLGTEHREEADKFTACEIADLNRGDVPLFTTKVDSRHLWYADDEYIPSFFERSGADQVRRKLAGLSPQDLERQLWIIGNCFIGDGPRKRRQARALLGAAAVREGAVLEDRLLAQASALASQLRGQMHVTDDGASWLVHMNTSFDSSRFELIPAIYDLLSGMPGEILFFSHLGQTMTEREHWELADKALKYLKERLEESRDTIPSLGLYAGWGSVVHLFTALAQLESNYQHLEYVEELLASPRMEELIGRDRNFSFIKGSAGFMLARSDLHLASGSKRALALAIACADHLLEHRASDVPGYAWRITSKVPLAGLAHGCSGFAMAFARLYEASGDARYRDAALSALEYERTLFHPESRNWLDRRDFVVAELGDRPVCSVGWAHGAPGVGLARLALLRAGIDSPQNRDELDIALRTTLDQGFSGGDSLIFGCFGNLELPISYVECFGHDSVPALPKLAATLLDRVEREGPDLKAPTPYPLGLMGGATGVAYQCLRLARMHRVPSVLGGTSGLPKKRAVS